MTTRLEMVDIKRDRRHTYGDQSFVFVQNGEPLRLILGGRPEAVGVDQIGTISVSQLECDGPRLENKILARPRRPWFTVSLIASSASHSAATWLPNKPGLLIKNNPSRVTRIIIDPRWF